MDDREEEAREEQQVVLQRSPGARVRRSWCTINPPNDKGKCSINVSRMPNGEGKFESVSMGVLCSPFLSLSLEPR